jgi:hypothetical protein|tara:strand:- start:1262 stop:1435 length:174 start_codon:yes stop_codon:yes gene_type:complete
MIDKKVLEKILNENNWGIYLKGRPLDEISTNVGVIYKIAEISSDRIVDEYNSTIVEE